MHALHALGVNVAVLIHVGVPGRGYAQDIHAGFGKHVDHLAGGGYVVPDGFIADGVQAVAQVDAGAPVGDFALHGYSPL